MGCKYSACVEILQKTSVCKCLAVHPKGTSCGALQVFTIRSSSILMLAGRPDRGQMECSRIFTMGLASHQFRLSPEQLTFYTIKKRTIQAHSICR